VDDHSRTIFGTGDEICHPKISFVDVIGVTMTLTTDGLNANFIHGGGMKESFNVRARDEMIRSDLYHINATFTIHAFSSLPMVLIIYSSRHIFYLFSSRGDTSCGGRRGYPRGWYRQGIIIGGLEVMSVFVCSVRRLDIRRFVAVARCLRPRLAIDDGRCTAVAHNDDDGKRNRIIPDPLLRVHVHR